MKLNLREDIANSIGAGFDTSQVGTPGKLSGPTFPIGCPTPLTKKNCMPERQAANKEQQEKRSKIVAMLLGKQFTQEEISEEK